MQVQELFFVIFCVANRMVSENSERVKGYVSSGDQIGVTECDHSVIELVRDVGVQSGH